MQNVVMAVNSVMLHFQAGLYAGLFLLLQQALWQHLSFGFHFIRHELRELPKC
jgi:hypothetical protein